MNSGIKSFILLTTEILFQVFCTEVQDYDLLTTPNRSTVATLDFKLSKINLDEEDYESWNSIDNTIHLHSSIPLVSNVVVTEQEPPSFQLDAFDPGGEFYPGQLLTDDYYNLTTRGNCTNTNETSCGGLMYGPAPTFQQSDMTRVVVLLFIAVFSLVGNAATLGSILRTGRQGTSTVYMLLVQLAVADLLVSVFCILADALWTVSVQWYGGNLLCKSVKFMQLFSLYLSTFLLVLIGFDRLCAVRFPMRRARAKHHVRVGIVCVWSLSALFSLPQVFIFSVMRGPFIEEFYQCVTYAFYTEKWQEQFYTTLSCILMFLLPLFILISTYIATFLTIAHSGQENMFSERMSRSVIDNARQKILHKAKIKSLMITVVIVLTFVVCWTPYYATMIIFMFMDPDEQLSQDLQKAIFFFGSSTAAINPLIYGAFHLRPKGRRRRSKSSTSLVNNSSSSRLETYSHLTLRRSLARNKSREENVALQIVNGEAVINSTSLYRQRYSSVSNCNRLIQQNSFQY